jgi:hypothetical protein
LIPKQTKTAAELVAMIIKELRKHSKCNHVMSVGITRPPQLSARDPTWAPAFTCDGPKIAPPIAFEIATKLQNLYDLV